MNEQLAALGFSLDSELTRDSFDGVDGDHTFRVTVSRGGQSYTTEYTAGCGHRHYRNGLAIRPPTSMATANLADRVRQTVPNIPTLTDVLYCLTMDAQGVSSGETFEDWAGSYGYDTDSREAERCFHACRDTYFGLVRIGADLEALGELFQDY